MGARDRFKVSGLFALSSVCLKLFFTMKQINKIPLDKEQAAKVKWAKEQGEGPQAMQAAIKKRWDRIDQEEASRTNANRSVMVTPQEIQDLREDQRATMESADKYFEERIAKDKQEEEQKSAKKR